MESEIKENETNTKIEPIVRNNSLPALNTSASGSNQSVNGAKSESNSNRNSGQFDVNVPSFRKNSEQLERSVFNFKKNSGTSDVVLRPKKTSNVNSDDGLPNLIPRRLSQLFTPPKEEELAKENADQANESTSLLGDASEHKKPTVKSKLSSKESTVEEDFEDRLSILERIERGKGNRGSGSDLGSSRPSSDHNGSSSDCSDDDNQNSFYNKNSDYRYTSWDDTICSNRSAYFKHYYQKYSSSIAPSRQSTRASSQTSLVSLIKEKNKMASISKEEEKKKRKENIGLTVLVIFLFLVLVIGISLIYHFYYIHLEELSLFKKLKFHDDRRLLNLYDSIGNMDIQARLGTTLSPYSKPEDCTHYLHYLQNVQIKQENENIEKLFMLGNHSSSDFIFRPTSEFQFDEETVCLDWANQARIQIHRAPTSKEFVNCYNVFWEAQNSGLALQDCMHISSPEYGVWWGIGDITDGGYPLETRSIPSSPLRTGQLGKDPWGRILRRAFVSSKGALLLIPDHLPASVSISPDELCIAVNVSSQIDRTLPLTLNYTVCASPNVSSTIKYLHHLVEDDFEASNETNQEYRERILERIENPVWIPDNPRLTQKNLLAYADQILAYNESLWGHILLPLSWQKKSGVMEFDVKKFPESITLSEKLRLKGFHLALTISPLIATESVNFRNGTREGYFVQQKGSNLPALISFDSVITGALTDFTNSRAVEWFLSKVESLKRSCDIDRFHLKSPDSFSIPLYHEFNQHISNSDLAFQPFIKSISKISPALSTDGSLGPPPIPTFVTIGAQESGWASLSSMVPRILSLTMLGFPLIDAGVIGGNVGRVGNVPDSELYTRWVQAATFLPAFQMSTLPTAFEPDTKYIVSHYFEKRRELVLPRLRNSVENTLLNKSSLISPLALLYPNDSEAANIGDEWIIGDDLLVAPVLEKGKTSRDIYLPEGFWESQLDGRLKRGPGWLYGYKVPLTDLAYFIKKYYSALSS